MHLNFWWKSHVVPFLCFLITFFFMYTQIFFHHFFLLIFFLSQHAFSQNLYCNNKKRFVSTLLSLNCINKIYCKFVSQTFFVIFFKFLFSCYWTRIVEFLSNLFLQGIFEKIVFCHKKLVCKKKIVCTHCLNLISCACVFVCLLVCQCDWKSPTCGGQTKLWLKVLAPVLASDDTLLEKFNFNDVNFFFSFWSTKTAVSW